MSLAHEGAKRHPCLTQSAAEGDKPSQRQILAPGGVFHQRPASPEALPSPQKGLGPKPSPDQRYTPPSFGSGFFQIFGAPAPGTSLPKNKLQAKAGSPDATFAPAKGVTADDSLSGPEGRLGITRNFPPTKLPEGANLAVTQAVATYDAAAQAAAKAGYKVISYEEALARTQEEDSRKKRMWGQFHDGLRQGRKQYARIRAADPKDPRLEILQHACFACRMSAGYRHDDDGERSVSIGYAEGELAWLGAKKCGSGRFCVLCGAAIAKRNQEEITEGLQNAIKKGFSCLLVTYTIPHKRTQSALELVEGFEKAREIAAKGGDISRFRKKHGFIGSIVRQEETYGVHGWHPHIHEIIILDHFPSLEEIQEIEVFLKQKWSDGCHKAVLIPENRTKAFDEYGFDIQPLRTTKEVADYLSKVGWRDSSAEFQEYAKKATLESSGKRIRGMAYEVGSHDSKAPRGAEGRTPWDIHKEFADGNPEDIRLWLEYVEAFKGKTLVRWSPNLKALLRIQDKDEEDQVSADEETSITHIYKIDEQQYVNGVAKPGLWLPILDAIGKHDFETLQAIADEYTIDFKRPGKAGGLYPEILSRNTVRKDEEEDRLQTRKELIKQAKDKVVKILARREAEKQAKIKADRDYRRSLLALAAK